MNAIAAPTPEPFQPLIGKSAVFLRSLTLIERIAHYEAPVLIGGETGTGKELARAQFITSRLAPTGLSSQ